MSGITKREFIQGASWKIIGDFSVKGVSFVISVVLARLLMPEDYGVIALTAVFTNLSDILIDSGFSTALIRKEKINEGDYCCALTISFSIALVLYICLFFLAPFAAEYYHEPMLTAVLRVISISLFLQAFTAVRTAVVNRNMQFKLLSICNASSSLISGIIGIIAAYLGLGVWALVIQRLLMVFIANVMLFAKVKLKIKPRFELATIKELASFSIGVVSSSLLNYAGGSLYSLVIGRKYSVTDLGYYEKGGQLPMQASLYTFGAMSSVLLPTIASYQNDLEKIKHIIRRIVRMTSYLIFPMMIGMLLVSKELMVFLFTEKWLPATNMMKSFCIYYLATPFMLINVQVFFAVGKSMLRVKTEIIRLVLMAVGLGVFGFILDWDVNGIAIVAAVIAVLSALATFYETRKLIGYRWMEVAKDIALPLGMTLFMAVVIGFVSETAFARSLSNTLALLLKVGIGVVSYVALSALFKVQEFKEFASILNFFKRGNETRHE